MKIRVLKNRLLLLIFLCFAQMTQAQTTPKIKDQKDTTNWHQLKDVTIVGRNSKSDYQQIPEIVGTNIYAGKKNALIVLDNVQGNIANNTMRQVLAKVPGIHIWESDPSGIQIGIAARGLSPNRSWEFNIRQNGYDIAADPFGYPEAYYNPQLQAVQRIEIVRGQGALQYGPQFGGMVNYILKNGSEINQSFEFETQQTIGSNGLINNFNAIGGKKEKVNYYSFYDQRNGEGWRNNSQFFSKAGFGSVTYHFTKKLSLNFELMHSHTRSQQAGGLTDLQIIQNAKQSFRNRNWMDIKWTTPAIHIQYEMSDHSRWNTKIFGTIGDRNSVGFLHSILVKDSINAATNQFNNRIVNIDQYRNYGLESRFITDYLIGEMKNTISTGIRLYTGNTHRLADGKGTTGSDFDISIEGLYPRAIQFRSNNAAVFVENIFRVTQKLLIIPGFRYEWLEGSAAGSNGFDANGAFINLQNITRNRNFVLGGIGSEFHLTNTTEFYANFSQAYRPIQFANLQAPPTTDLIDQDLKDARGYNLDLGYRGKIKNYLQFDLSGFYLKYNNRVGTITPLGANYRLVTNVGASTSKGFETYIEFNPVRAFSNSVHSDIILFSSYAYTDARYSGNHKDANTKGKKVENAPQDILRTGLSFGYKSFLCTTQLSHVAAAFSDANNTNTPSANGNIGIIPSYTIIDLTASYKYSKKINIKAGINNINDTRYFTRRAGGYPGPGALPADGRNFFLSIGAKF
jgi:Fe(3+) dicitrate transport protein